MQASEEIEDLQTAEHDGFNWRSLEPRINQPEFAATGLDDKSVGHPLPFQRAAKKVTLKAHLKFLRSLSKENAIMILGEGDSDRQSTSFLSSFYGHFPSFPDLVHWQCRLDLLYDAVKLGHPNYGKQAMYDVLGEMKSSGVEILHKPFEDVLRLVLGPENFSRLPWDDQLSSTVEDVENFLNLSSDMELHSFHIFDEPTLAPLLRTLTRMQYAADVTKINRDALWRLINVLDKHGVYLKRSSSHYFIMNTLSNAGDWQGFWRYWWVIARRMQRKSFILYAHMSRIMARQGHQVECITALETGFLKWSSSNLPCH